MKYFRVISFLLLNFSFLSCSDFTSDPISASEPQSAEFTITFLYFTPYVVEISSTIDNWESHNIWQPNTNTFKFAYTNVTGSNKASIKFSVRNPLPDNFDITSWINGGAGIRYADVKINGVSLNYLYAVDNNLHGSDITFLLNSDGSPSPDGIPVNPNENIPPEVFTPRRYVNTNTVPVDTNYIQGWLQALHDNRYPNDVSTIEVKSIKLYAYINNSTNPTLILSYSYIPNSPFYDGGLFYRYPFYPDGDFHDPMTPYSVINSSGVLTFHPSDLKNKVWHWWNEPRVKIPQGATAFRLESEIRITGKAVVEAGIDFKTQFTPIGKECGSGDWYFKQTEWQTVVFDSS